MSGDRARVLLGALVFLVLVAAAVVWRHRLAADFLPLDASRVGPNLVAAVVQGGVVFILAVLLYPPLRRTAHRFIDSKLNHIHERVEALHDRHDQHNEHLVSVAQNLKALHDRLEKLEAKDAKPRARRVSPRP